MNLLEDALVQYDELEASFLLGMKDQSLPWFRSVGGTAAGDDSLSVLSFTSKPFRDLIIQNNISIFDFRIYLFARQAALIVSLGRIGDLAKRGKEFIYAMARFIRAHGVSLQRRIPVSYVDGLLNWSFVTLIIAGRAHSTMASWNRSPTQLARRSSASVRGCSATQRARLLLTRPSYPSCCQRWQS